jgi:YD repeat-containing protein
VRDSLTLTYPQQYHHYTLYYYDRSGQLTKTIPPQGVNPLSGSLASRNQSPAHEYATTYRYNSLGQLTRQFTPDADTTHYVYNRQGQLRLSQNAVQRAAHAYSYTKYDELGRVNEVGEARKRANQPLPAFTASVQDNTAQLALDTTLGYV